MTEPCFQLAMPGCGGSAIRLVLRQAACCTRVTRTRVSDGHHGHAEVATAGSAQVSVVCTAWGGGQQGQPSYAQHALTSPGALQRSCWQHPASCCTVVAGCKQLAHWRRRMPHGHHEAQVPCSTATDPVPLAECSLALLTAAVVVHASLGKHGVVLQLGLAHGLDVVGDDDQLGCKDDKQHANITSPRRADRQAGMHIAPRCTQPPFANPWTHPCQSAESQGRSCSPGCTCGEQKQGASMPAASGTGDKQTS